MSQVKNKPINVSYKGILRISPNEKGEDLGYGDFKEYDTINVMDSDGGKLPLYFKKDEAYFTKGVNVDGDLFVKGGIDYNGSLKISEDIIVSTTTTTELTVKNNLTVLKDAVFQQGITVEGMTKLQNLEVSDSILANAENIKLFYTDEDGGRIDYKLKLLPPPDGGSFVVVFDDDDVSNQIKLVPLKTMLKSMGVRTNESEEEITNGYAVGDIKWTFDSVAPLGFLRMDGRRYSKTTYFTLYDKLHKQGMELYEDEDEDTFMLPDMRGMFPRVVNNSNMGADKNRKAGDIQTSAAPNITGTFNLVNYLDATTGAFVKGENKWGTGAMAGTGATRNVIQFNASKSDSAGVYKAGMKEVRPHNVAMYAYIYCGVDTKEEIDVDAKIKEVVDGKITDSSEIYTIASQAFNTGREDLKYANKKDYLSMTGYKKGEVEDFGYNLMSLNNVSSSITTEGKCTVFSNDTNLKSFASDLVSLEDGTNMFYGCTNLTSFGGSLMSLKNGDGMFHNCKLDLQSLARIAETINRTTGSITIGINRTPTDEDKEQINKITGKGWTVVVCTNQENTDKKHKDETFPKS